MSKVIGLIGYAGCGKGAAAEFLEQQYGWERVKFAGALKEMLRSLYRQAGLFEQEIERRIEGDLKEVHCDYLNTTPRRAMLTLGTEWGRKQIDEHLWTRIATANVQRLLHCGLNVVLDDVRFPNEHEALRRLGAKFIRIVRDTGCKYIPHESESHVETLDVDFIVPNNGSLEDLYSAIERITEEA